VEHTAVGKYPIVELVGFITVVSQPVRLSFVTEFVISGGGGIAL